MYYVIFICKNFDIDQFIILKHYISKELILLNYSELCFCLLGPVHKSNKRYYNYVTEPHPRH